MKKRWSILLMLICFSLFFVGCNQKGTTVANGNEDSDKIQIITTLFPQYDFARIVGGDKVEVVKLLPNGVESHSYEPAPSDIVDIGKAEMFIYTGATMEPWAATIIDSIDSASLTVVDVSKNVSLLAEEEDVHEEHYGADPHIWTDPIRAMVMVDTISLALQEKDPKNADYYQANADAYKQELSALDDEIKAIVAEGQRNKMIFGGRFAFLYFTDHYGLEHDAAIDSCAESGEPSAKKVAELVDEIKAENIPVVYYEELSSTKVAGSIASETGAELLLFHSCHNITDDELAQGVSYLSLMRQNAENLKKGLN